MSRHGHEVVEEREYYASHRDRPRSRAPIAEYDEVDVRERRRTRDGPDFLRDGYGRSSEIGQLVVRDRSRSRDRRGASTVGRSRRSSDLKEDFVVRTKASDRPRKSDVRTEEEIILTEREPTRRRDVVEEDVLVVRDREKERPRPKDVQREEEIIISDHSSERPRRRDYTEEELIIASRDPVRDRSRGVTETIIYPEYDSRQQIRREHEDFVYRERLDGKGRNEAFLPPPRINRGQDVRFEREDYDFAERRRSPSPDPAIREEIIIRDEEKSKPRRQDDQMEEIIIRDRERDRPRYRDEREEEIIIRDSERERPRYRDDREEEIVIREREREREAPRYSDSREEDIIIQRRERERDRPRHLDDHSHEIVIRERSRERPRYRDEFEEQISIRERDRDRPRYRGDFHEEDISIRERDTSRRGYRDEREEIIIRERDREREQPRQNEERDETIIIRKNDRSRDPPPSRRRGYEADEISIRESRHGNDRLDPHRGLDRDVVFAEKDRSRVRGYKDSEDDEIIIRRSTNKSRGASPTRSIRRGDHEEEEFSTRRSERERDLPRRRDRSRDRDEEDITIKHKDDGHGGHSDQIIIKRDRSPSPVHAPSPPPPPAPVRAPPVIQEVITHHRHIDHGFERAPESPRLAPPRQRSPSGTEDERIHIRTRSKSHGRVHEDDIDIEIDHRDGRRHEGVHHGRGNNEAEGRELALIDTRDPRHYVKQNDPRDRLWTEITVDLVSEEAIKEMGYEYTRSGGNYYVYKYLKYEDVQALVDLTEEISRDRRDRIHDMQEERSFMRSDGQRRLPGPSQQWDEERVVEREIIYDDGSRRRRR